MILSLILDIVMIIGCALLAGTVLFCIGMFAFGIFHKKQVKGSWVPLVCILAPILCYMLKENSVELLNGYKIGFELLIINGLLTYLGFWAIIKRIDN